MRPRVLPPPGLLGLSGLRRRNTDRKEGFHMIKIAPSILSADFANLERDIHRISTADYVHVDVMDGVFVPNISIGIPVVQSIRKVTDMFLDVHLMIVEPGFGGQKFMADMMPKVTAIRKLIDEKNPACELEVDGGVAPDTCKTCIEAGANVLVAGSAVYKAPDIPARIAELRG